ncbi:MAG: phosphate permease [Bacteroidales bacterium]|nr:phosphate permease [Bacteroidales bacterium]
MSDFYLILTVVLFALAISDLIVGVSNDAVNFLNSAIGSKSAPKWLIFGIAGLGILIGSTFSNGMMEIARKGIFHPEMFVFSEIMVIFLAVMITDVIILDLFNTFGFPTSTTVSIVFELLGAAVSVSLVKMAQVGEAFTELSKYINSEKALMIIVGILTSVVISFIVGVLIHWITRFLFSFRYESRLKYLGGIYGSLAITFIIYFMIIKGAKDASFMTPENYEWISANMKSILIYCFIGLSILLQGLYWLFKIDILKVVVLAGTFALAWAFAGNDLVNFIGVPLAGFAAYKSWVASGVPADSFNMISLQGEVKTPTIMLVIAGIIMVVTLISSKKARSVIKTSVDLSRQTEGEERFSSSAFSRLIVGVSMRTSDMVSRIVPVKVSNFIERQFQTVPEDKTIAASERPAFDKLRAASNLLVAAVLISIGTSLKLPLSTTYVTFMVAMSTSLADRAWGRESAVYRISGVVAVIAGWFLTAVITFTVAFFVARIINWGGIIAIAILIALALFLILRSTIIFKRREKIKAEAIEEEDALEQNFSAQKILEKCNKNALKSIISTSKAYYLCFEGFFNDDRLQLKSAVAEAEEIDKKAKKWKDNVFKTIEKLQQDQIDTGHFYVQVVDYLREMAHSLNYTIKPVYTHFENKHKAFDEEQIEEFNQFRGSLNDFFNYSIYILREKRFDEIDELIEKRVALVNKLKELEKSHIKRIKNKAVSTRNSILYFNIISETKTLLLNLINVVKAQRDFVEETKPYVD